jgi:hypothetical protein
MAAVTLVNRRRGRGPICLSNQGVRWTSPAAEIAGLMKMAFVVMAHGETFARRLKLIHTERPVSDFLYSGIQTTRKGRHCPYQHSAIRLFSRRIPQLYNPICKNIKVLGRGISTSRPVISTHSNTFPHFNKKNK